MRDTDTTQWPPLPLHPSPSVLEVGYVRLVRTEDCLTISDSTKGRTLWIGLLMSFLYVPLFIGVIMLALALTHVNAAGDGTLHRLFVHEFWSHRLQYACATICFMAFWWFLNFISRNYGLFVFDKQHNIFQKRGKDFYPLSEAIAVRTVKIDGFWQVQFVREGGDRRPQWLKVLTYPSQGDYTSVAQFRKREHAEQVAAIVADFAGVELQFPPR